MKGVIIFLCALSGVFKVQAQINWNYAKPRHSLGLSLSVSQYSNYNLFDANLKAMDTLFPSMNSNQPGYQGSKYYNLSRSPSFVNINFGVHYYVNRFFSVNAFASGFSVQNSTHFSMEMTAGKGIYGYSHFDSLGGPFCNYDSSQYYNARVDWTGKMRTIGGEISLHTSDEKALSMGCSFFFLYHWLGNSQATELITESIVAGHHYYDVVSTGNWWNPFIHVSHGERITYNEEISRKEVVSSPSWSYKNVGCGLYGQWNANVGSTILSTYFKVNIGSYSRYPLYDIVTPKRQNTSLLLGVVVRPVSDRK